MLQQMAKGMIAERKRKVVQFSSILWLLMQGCLLNQFKNLQELLELLFVPDFPTKHWNIPIAWEMADHLAKALTDHTKQVISKAWFFSLSADEVSTVDSQSWLSIHLHICVGFKQVPILLSLSQLVEGNEIEDIRECIDGMVSHHTSLFEVEVASRLVCFGADDASVF